MPDTSSSRTLNADHLIHGMLTTIWHLWVQSASLEEKSMLTEALTSMLSLISGTNSDPAGEASLMSEAAILTLSHLKKAHAVVTTTQLKMETLWLEGSSGQAQMELAKMALSGARLSARRTSYRFGNTLSDWIQGRWQRISATSESSPTGDTKLNPIDTNTPDIWNLATFEAFVNGEMMNLVDL